MEYKSELVDAVGVLQASNVSVGNIAKSLEISEADVNAIKALILDETDPVKEMYVAVNKYNSMISTVDMLIAKEKDSDDPDLSEIHRFLDREEKYQKAKVDLLDKLVEIGRKSLLDEDEEKQKQFSGKNKTPTTTESYVDPEEDRLKMRRLNMKGFIYRILFNLENRGKVLEDLSSVTEEEKAEIQSAVGCNDKDFKIAFSRVKNNRIPKPIDTKTSARKTKLELRKKWSRSK